MNSNTITNGQIVTFDFGTENSNTFYVRDVIGEEALLYHPLKPSVLKLIPLDKLNLVQANLKSDLDRMFELVHLHEKSLGYDSGTSFEMLCYFYIQNRKLLNPQKKELSNLAGIVAGIVLNSNLEEAKRLINTNVALLDSFNQLWYNNLKDTILKEGGSLSLSDKQKMSIFNMAGFVLAQSLVDKAAISG